MPWTRTTGVPEPCRLHAIVVPSAAMALWSWLTLLVSSSSPGRRGPAYDARSPPPLDRKMPEIVRSAGRSRHFSEKSGEGWEPGGVATWPGSDHERTNFRNDPASPMMGARLGQCCLERPSPSRTAHRRRWWTGTAGDRSPLDTDGCDHAHAPGQDRPLRPATRARLVRRLLRRQPARRSFQRTGAHRPHRADEPRAPRRDRRRGRHRRRRRHPAAGPGRALSRRRRVRSPRRRALRHRHRVPAHRRRRLRQGDRRHRVDDGRRGTGGPRLARTPDRPHLPRRHRTGGDAALHATVRERPRRDERHRTRSQGVRRPQAPAP